MGVKPHITAHEISNIGQKDHHITPHIEIKTFTTDRKKGNDMHGQYYDE